MGKRKKSYQKWVKAAITSTIATSAVVTVAPGFIGAEGLSFSDVLKSDYYYDALQTLTEKGIIDGYKDGTYRPDQQVTRAEAAKIIALALGLHTENVKDPGLKDIHDSDWFYGPVAALVDAGVINGYEDGTFKPDEPLSRAEMAKIITVGFGLEETALRNSRFSDVKAEDWYANYIQALLTYGITTGKTATTYAPEASVKRGEMAAFVYRSANVMAPTPSDGNGAFTLSLMHTNDTHAHLDNIAKVATAVKEVRAEKPEALLVSAGDVFSGTLYFNEFLGQADLTFMNLLGYDVMTFGNHEFDLGSSPQGHQALVDFIEAATFPFVSANVDFREDEKFAGLFSDLISSEPENGKIYSGIVKEVDGEKVGFFGLTTAETADISSPGEIPFKDYLDEAEKAVKAFEDIGVDKIVAVTHIGYNDNANVDNDVTLAAQVDGIDVIVGGHDHTVLAEPVIVDKDENGAGKDPTVIVQANEYHNYLGTVDVEFDENGKVVGYAGELIEIGDKEEDEETAKLLEEYSERVKKIEQSPVGATTEKALENPRLGNGDPISVRNSETPLGNLITDGMLAKAKEYDENVVIALQNGGGIRAPIDAGEITVGEVITVLPFGNTLATMDVTGAELKEAFEISLKSYPEENGGFLHVSGAKVAFDSSKPAGERVVSIAIQHEDGMFTEVKDAETYTVATNAFTAKGGDGYTVFAKAYEEGRVTDLGLSDWENFAEHLKQLGTIVPTTEGRMIDEA